ncbi:MAG: phosphoenolpyruvate--protein phosphotransferase [Candidatus Eisenbacteria bacterium]|uniref:Phosphoenolpyruvate-protein phosphotransferase n=1 Tax=Eiseniibacteriota bacterium TaxID=2212470 RepID=A0A7Y2H323_UNCEI|nr:phosphoenolpyruvate--protein phosphotransferase [Candidatus Eisenbacteria bacterium]
MAKKSSSGTEDLRTQGIPAAPGIAFGPVQFLSDQTPQIEEKKLESSELDQEKERFTASLEKARTELREIRRVTAADLGEDEAKIFDVQLMVLDDPMIQERVVEAIAEEQLNAAYLLERTMLEVADRLASMGDGYFANRTIDLHDVKKRLLRHLLGEQEVQVSKTPSILVGRELAPSDAVHLDPNAILGFATELGGVTSHASIMARAKGLPAVVGAKGIKTQVQSGDVIAIDGISGAVVVNPSASTLKRMRERKRAYERLQTRREKYAKDPAITTDGMKVKLAANIETPSELEFIKEKGAEGIGLFRTEFFFMESQTLPTEDEQYDCYRGLVSSMAPLETVIRVLDVGGDKVTSYLGLARERNPYLGMRGIRYLLAHPEIFKAQLGAILRAGAHGPIRILFPMVSSVEEFMEAKRLTQETIQALKEKGLPHDDKPVLGVMIEVPSTVMLVEEFAREADFLSIGSNDLIQYMLAVDRDHETLRHLYQPLHPAILRAIQAVTTAAEKHGKWVSICGEMAGLSMFFGCSRDRLNRT